MSTRRAAAALGALLLMSAATATGDLVRRTGAPSPVLDPLANGYGSALPRFALFGWVSPPNDSATAARYAELAGAGFNTTVLAWEDDGSLDANLARLSYARPVGVHCLLFDRRLANVASSDPSTFATLDSVVAAYRDDAAFLGYYLGDEPAATDLPQLADLFALLRTRDPAHPAWNNLAGLSAYGSRAQFQAAVRAYADSTHPAVLSADFYDFFLDHDGGRFVDNVSAFASVSREYGLPFWGIVLLVQHGPYRSPSDGELRWQFAQWMSYGASGIGTFTYWTPAPDPAWNWQPAMIDYATGRRTANYARVAAVNAHARPIGEALARCAWVSTEHANFLPTGGTPFAADSVLAAVSGRAAIGTFADSSGAPCLFVANSDSASERTITLDFSSRRAVSRLGDDGAWKPVIAAGGRRVTLDLAAGDFTLLRLSGDLGQVSSGASTALLVVSPNPAHGATRFDVSATRGAATLSVLDPSGRRIWHRGLAGATPSLSWDGVRDDGRRAAPGVYFARVQDATGAVTRRFAWTGSR